MIKKVFVGGLLAIIFGLLILGAVNRTLAKSSDDGPFAVSQNLSEGNGSGNGRTSHNQTHVQDSPLNDVVPNGKSHGYGGNSLSEDSVGVYGSQADVAVNRYGGGNRGGSYDEDHITSAGVGVLGFGLAKVDAG